MTDQETSGRIRSDAATVNRVLAEIDARRKAPAPNPYPTRHYIAGGDPGWCCQGGLPSLGEGYS